MKTIKEKYREAKEYIKSKKFTSYDFKGTSIIRHHDESEFKFCWSILEENDDFVFVFSEHNGYHFFYKEDLEEWKFEEDIRQIKDNMV